MPKIDWFLFVPSLLLTILGLIVVYSIAPQYLSTQSMFAAAGIILALLMSLIDIEIILAFVPIYFILSVLGLVLTLIFGRITRGSSRWLSIGSFRLQISEFIKPLSIMILAYISQRFKVRKFPQLLLLLLLIAIPVGLVLIQPDLGSSIVILMISGWLILGIGTKKRFITLILLLFILATPIAWHNLADYQQRRVLSFINPNLDPLGSSYNQVQAMIAAGSGRLWGLGLGKGSQSHLSFLPEKQTDFIFAAAAEELGFVGVLLILFLFLGLSVRLLHLASLADKKWQKLIFLGSFVFIFGQFVIHVGINLGFLPVTGLTLPFISVGGSSMLVVWFTIGLAMSLGQRIRIHNAITLR